MTFQEQKRGLLKATTANDELHNHSKSGGLSTSDLMYRTIYKRSAEKGHFNALYATSHLTVLNKTALGERIRAMTK